MHRFVPLAAAAALLSIGLAPPVQAQAAHGQPAGQAARAPAGPAIAYLSSSRSATPPTAAPSLPPHPAKLTQGEFAGLRSGLATRLGLSQASIPSMLLTNGTLATPGSTLNVSPSSIPTGGGFVSYGMVLYEGSMLGTVYSHSVAQAVTSTDLPNCHVICAAPIASPGIFLMTVYVDTNLPTVTCQALSGGNGSYEYSPIAQVAPQGGKLFLTFECTHASPRQVAALAMVPNRLQANQHFRVYSCDFVRIK